MLGFKQFRNAAVTIAGIELMHSIPKRRFYLRRLGAQGEAAPGTRYSGPAFHVSSLDDAGGWLVGGIVWHISVMWIVFVDGVAYLLYGFSTGHFRRD